MLIFWQNYISLIILCPILIKAVSNQIRNLKPEHLCQEEGNFCIKPKEIFLLYDVNPVEGFNLRRDVYIRIANLVKKINNERIEFRFKLVLPPWHNLYHWKSKQVQQSMLDWKNFFDINSLKEYIPVIELSDIINETNGTLILDQIYFLENDFENFNNEPFNKFLFQDNCDQKIYFKEKEFIRGNFWGYGHKIRAKKCQKIKFRGTNFYLGDNLIKILRQQDSKFLMIDRAEAVIHQDYGQSEYWKCRKSMKFSHILVDKGLDLVKSLNTDEKKKIGGNYLAVHLRRGDFLKHRPSVSIEKICKQVKMVLEQVNLKKVFIATDGTESEIRDVKNLLLNFDVIMYNPTEKDLQDYKDGGISIIDQIVCSYAEFFIGTRESTFSLRIQEEREILGFDSSTTFNCFCNDEKICETNKWLLKN